MKKGFTLVEALAVIVVLGLIALIVTPIVKNILIDSRVNAAKRSMDAYRRAVELSVSNSEFSDNPIRDGSYSINNDGSILKDGKFFNISILKNYPKNGSLVIENEKVVSMNATIDNITLDFDGNRYSTIAID